MELNSSSIQKEKGEGGAISFLSHRREEKRKGGHPMYGSKNTTLQHPLHSIGRGRESSFYPLISNEEKRRRE